MNTSAIVAAITVALASAVLAQDTKETPPEMAAVTANDRAYEAAYAKADVKALAEFFAEDAEYTADDGRSFVGKAAITEAIRAGLLANKGAKLTIAADSVKLLAPEVLLEKGSTTVDGKDGESNAALFSAIFVKKEGKWKISQLIETPFPEVTPHDRLKELEWIVGEWEDEDKTSDISVRNQYLWARSGNFLTRNVTVKRGGETTLEGWQIIGWDPLEERIRSWTFDDEGGFAEGLWTREGERWLLRESGVAPDGARTSAENTFTKISADRYAWESNNRTLNGDPQPSIGRIVVNRVKGN